MRFFKKPRRLIYITAGLAVLIALAFILVHRSGSPRAELEAKLNALAKTAPVYRLNLELDPDSKILKGTEELRYTNTEKVELKQLYFHLYPNAFRSQAETPFPKEDMNLAYPRGFEPGWLTIDRVGIAGSPVKYSVSSTILKVTLPKPVKHGETLVIGIDFTVRVPPSVGRFGYGNHAFNMANCYPILAVYDRDGWNLDSYYSIGDPFYSDAGFYEASIAVPKGYVVAHTGETDGRFDTDSKTVYKVKAGPVRDFAWVASSRFVKVSRRVEGIDVKSYAVDAENARAALEVAADSLKIFNRLFGHYPYKSYSVVGTEFYIGGMEYPGLVLIGEELYGDDVLEYVVAHETAHQWWYGVVGNDQVDDAWLDEGLTEYSTVLYYESKYGKNTFDKVYTDTVVNRYNLYKLEQGASREIHRPLYRYKDWKEYDALVYARSAMLFHGLRDKMGDKAFFDFLKKYYIKYAYENVSTGEFLEFLESYAGREYGEFIQNGLSREL